MASKDTPRPSSDDQPSSSAVTGKDKGPSLTAGGEEEGGGYLRKDQLQAVMTLISGVTVAQARSPYSLKDAADLWAEVKDKAEDSTVIRGVKAAQQKSPYSLEDASLLYDAVQLLVSKPDKEQS